VKLEEDDEKEQLRMVEMLNKIERPIESKNRSLLRGKSYKNILGFI
jgi:hypothetical protein